MQKGHSVLINSSEDLMFNFNRKKLALNTITINKYVKANIKTLAKRTSTSQFSSEFLLLYVVVSDMNVAQINSS